MLSRIPGGRRSPEALAQIPKFSFSAFGDVFRTLLHDRRFLFYFGSIMFFYMGWHLDWTMWYLGQTQYVGLTEAQLSWYSAACAILQLLTLGIFARANEKKTVHFTFIFCVLSLMLCPLTMLVSGLAPWGCGPPYSSSWARSYAFPRARTTSAWSRCCWRSRRRRTAPSSSR